VEVPPAFAPAPGPPELPVVGVLATAAGRALRVAGPPSVRGARTGQRHHGHGHASNHRTRARADLSDHVAGVAGGQEPVHAVASARAHPTHPGQRHQPVYDPPAINAAVETRSPNLASIHVTRRRANV
jgi:hypothetical protein